MPDLELGDELTNALGTEAQNPFDQNAPPTKKKKKIKFLKILWKNTKQKRLGTRRMKLLRFQKVFIFFYSGDSKQFVNALEFIGLSPINREFSAFLLSGQGRKTMTQNKLSIHVESGDIFQDNHNTGENFYDSLLSQQNEEAAYVQTNETNEKLIDDDFIDLQTKFDRVNDVVTKQKKKKKKKI